MLRRDQLRRSSWMADVDRPCRFSFGTYVYDSTVASDGPVAGVVMCLRGDSPVEERLLGETPPAVDHDQAGPPTGTVDEEPC